jgi:hypothetical protein
MPNSTFDIQISTNSRDSRIKLNGEDITSLVNYIKIEQRPNHPPLVTLGFVQTQQGLVAQAQAEGLIRLQNEPQDTPDDPRRI